MTMIDHPSPYSAGRAKRSLVQFAIGKVCSATLGVAVLLLSLRLLPAVDFGRYVAAIAYLEIFYLLTGFGLSTVAQRYVAEFRLRAGHAQFSHFIRGIVVRRAVYAAGGALITLLAITLWASGAGEIPTATQIPGFYALLVLGCMTRYLDEIFPALLLQAHTQGLLLAGHLVRLAGMLGAVGFGLALDFKAMVYVELCASATVCVAGLALLYRQVRVGANPGAATATHHSALMPGVTRRFYVVQVLGQAWGPNTAKLIVTNQLGLAVTAGYGFLQSIVDMLRNYLPAYLLANWLRPLMIARYLAGGSLTDVNAMAGLMLKLSLMCIVPMAAFFLAGGDRFVLWISNGKFSDGASVLFALCVLLACQCLHVVVSMITMTVERAGASVVATMASCVALPLCFAGAALMGVTGVVGAMVIGECIWITTVLLLLRRDGLTVAVDAAGCARILLTGIPAYFAVVQLPSTWPTIWFCAAGVALACGMVATVNMVLKPFLPLERAFVGRLLPLRLFFW